MIHKFIPEIRIELVSPTNRGWKVKETKPKMSGRGVKTITSFYSKVDLEGEKALFKEL